MVYYTSQSTILEYLTGCVPKSNFRPNIYRLLLSKGCIKKPHRWENSIYNKEKDTYLHIFFYLFLNSNIHYLFLSTKKCFKHLQPKQKQENIFLVSKH